MFASGARERRVANAGAGEVTGAGEVEDVAAPTDGGDKADTSLGGACRGVSARQRDRGSGRAPGSRQQTKIPPGWREYSDGDGGGGDGGDDGDDDDDDDDDDDGGGGGGGGGGKLSAGGKRRGLRPVRWPLRPTATTRNAHLTAVDYGRRASGRRQSAMAVGARRRKSALSPAR